MDELDELIAQGPTTYVGRIVFDDPLEIAFWKEEK